jgi:tetratricopeptide (TPR) repeat protein
LNKSIFFGVLAVVFFAAAASCQQQQPQQQKPAADGNPFPGEQTDAPVLPQNNALAPTEGDENAVVSRNVPAADTDPARSPEDSELMTTSPTGVDALESSSTSGIDSSSPDQDQSGNPAGKSRGNRGKKGEVAEPEHQETVKEDVDVGSLYLDQKNYKAALSRFQSAMVLDPENPDAFFGIAEAERHLGKLADAKLHYQRVVDYDPDSKHGKQAKKAIKELGSAK